jgi:hypothetical protein
VALNDDDFVRPLGPALDRDDVDQVDGCRDTRSRRRGFWRDNLKTPTARLARGAELRLTPAPGGADPALRIVLRRKRVTGSEFYQRGDVRAQANLRNVGRRITPGEYRPGDERRRKQG